MLTYKTKLDIDSELLQLTLPPVFTGKRVEIIVLEIDDNSFEQTQKNSIEKTENDEPNELQNFLLTAPTWSEKEYENFIDTKELINQWKIK